MWTPRLMRSVAMIQYLGVLLQALPAEPVPATGAGHGRTTSGSLNAVMAARAWTLLGAPFDFGLAGRFLFCSGFAL